jgi:hypothetical protein
MTFPAVSDVPYHLWARLRGQGNSFLNDSIQFSDAVTVSGNPMMRIGTIGSAEVVLQNGSGGSADRGWGWADNGWGALGQSIYFGTTGTHRVRVQQREDGALVDQIVLSPDQYLSLPPGPRQDDTTVLNATSSGCLASFSPSSTFAGKLLATWSVNISASCTWTARSDVEWLEIKNPATGLFVHGTNLTFTGSSTITVHALTNSGPRRSGHFLIGQQVYSVTQEAAAGF